MAEAREEAFANRKIARNGGNPLADKRRGNMLTFAEATQQAMEIISVPLRTEKRVKRWLQPLEKHAFPILAHLSVDRIGRQEVLNALSPIWTTHTETAREVRRKIGEILKWCKAHGYVEINWAGDAIDGALPRIKGNKTNFRALPYADMPEVFHITSSAEGPTSRALCLQFIILTATRSGEARHARWKEIDLKQRAWRIPEERTKTGREHRQPLSPPALSVLEEARDFENTSELIFPAPLRGDRPLQTTALHNLLERNGLKDRMTVHGCRATFRT